jgi:hypothetical protein
LKIMTLPYRRETAAVKATVASGSGRDIDGIARSWTAPTVRGRRSEGIPNFTKLLGFRR